MNTNFKAILFIGLSLGLSGCGSSSSEEATVEHGPVTQQAEKKVASILTKENYVGMAQMQYSKELSSATYASGKEVFSLNIPSEKRVDVRSSYKTYNNQKVFNEMTISNNDAKLSFTVSDDKSMVYLTLKEEGQEIATTAIAYEEFLNFLPTKVE